MKKIIIACLILISFASVALAEVAITNPLKYDTFVDLVKAVTDFVFTLSLWVAPISFVVAGFFYVTAMGEPEKVKLAKNIIIYTMIGLIVAISAKALVDLFKEIFAR